jgi:hypothetical protein
MKTIPCKLLTVLGAIALVACGSGGGDTKSDDEKAKASQEDAANRPEDSTGQQGKVVLSFGSKTGAALRLQDSTDTTTATDTTTDTSTDTSTDTTTATSTATTTSTSTTLAISDSIELTEARFNIAAIKMKPTKERTRDEDEKDAVVAAEEKAAAEQIEALEQEGDQEAEESADAKPKNKDEDGDGHEGHEGDDAAGNGHEGHEGDDDAAGDDEGDDDEEHDHKSFKERLLAKLQARKEKILAKIAELKAGEHGRLEHEAKSDRAVRWAGPYLYDAISGQVTGDLPATELADGSYRRIEFKLRRNFDELEGHVLMIKGNFKDGDTVTPFEITWNCAMNLRLRSDTPYEVAPGGDNKLAIVFDLTTWFDGVDLSKADVDADGTIRVNRHSNRDLVRQMRRNIKTGLKFGKDSDGDGKLAETETVGAGEDTQDAVTEE